jgi:hypothetical protein
MQEVLGKIYSDRKIPQVLFKVRCHKRKSEDKQISGNLCCKASGKRAETLSEGLQGRIQQGIATYRETKKKMKRTCAICGIEIPANRKKTCSKKCSEVYQKKNVQSYSWKLYQKAYQRLYHETAKWKKYVHAYYRRKKNEKKSGEKK